MTIAWVLIGAALLLGVIGAFFTWRLKVSERAFRAQLAELDLTEFHAQLTADIAARRRPMSDLALPRTMIEVLRHLGTIDVPPGQVALLVPRHDAERAACEELTKLGRLVRSPDGKSFIAGRIKDSAKDGPATGSSSKL